jgi:hypothetical protein
MPQVLCICNASPIARNPLSLLLSVDSGRTWEQLTEIERDEGANFSYPCIVEWLDDTVKVWGGVGWGGVGCGMDGLSEQVDRKYGMVSLNFVCTHISACLRST